MNGMSLHDAKPCTAIAHQEICYYLEVLKELNRQAERLCRVQVLAGQIDYKKSSLRPCAGW